MLKTKIDLPSVEEFLKQQEEEKQKGEMANVLMNLQNSLYVNVGLSPIDIKSIATETKFDLANPRDYQEAMTYISNIKEKVTKHINTMLEKGYNPDDFEDLVIHYKYFRVMLLLVCELLERSLTEGRDLIRENQRLEAVAKPRLDGLEAYRQDIRQQEHQKARTLAEKALSGFLPEPKINAILNGRLKKLIETEGEE